MMIKLKKTNYDNYDAHYDDADYDDFHYPHSRRNNQHWLQLQRGLCDAYEALSLLQFFPPPSISLSHYCTEVPAEKNISHIVLDITSSLVVSSLSSPPYAIIWLFRIVTVSRVNFLEKIHQHS